MALFTCKKKSHIQALLIVISSLIPCVVVLMSILTQRKWSKKFKENYSCHKSLTFHIIYHCQIEVCFKLDWDDWGTFISVLKKILNNPVEDINKKCSFDHVSFLQKFHPFFIFLKHRTTNNPLKQNQRVPFSKHAHGAFFCVSWMEILWIFLSLKRDWFFMPVQFFFGQSAWI